MMTTLNSTNGQTIAVYKIVNWVITTSNPVADLSSKLIGEKDVVVSVYQNFYFSLIIYSKDSRIVDPIVY